MIGRLLALPDYVGRRPCPGFDDAYRRNGNQSMNKITPFLWFNDNAEEAADFYLSGFPEPKKMGVLRSSGVGPWPAGKIAIITIGTSCSMVASPWPAAG